MKRREFVGRGLGALVAGSLVSSKVVAEDRGAGGQGPGGGIAQAAAALVLRAVYPTNPLRIS